MKTQDLCTITYQQESIPNMYVSINLSLFGTILDLHLQISLNWSIYLRWLAWCFFVNFFSWCFCLISLICLFHFTKRCISFSLFPHSLSLSLSLSHSKSSLLIALNANQLTFLSLFVHKSWGLHLIFNKRWKRFCIS